MISPFDPRWMRFSTGFLPTEGHQGRREERGGPRTNGSVDFVLPSGMKFDEADQAATVRHSTSALGNVTLSSRLTASITGVTRGPAVVSNGNADESGLHIWRVAFSSGARGRYAGRRQGSIWRMEPSSWRTEQHSSHTQTKFTKGDLASSVLFAGGSMALALCAALL